MNNSEDFINRVEHFTKAEIVQKIGIKAQNFQSWRNGLMPS